MYQPIAWSATSGSDFHRKRDTSVHLLEYTYSSKDGSVRHFLVEEYVEGQDLTERLASGRALPRRDVATLFGSLCSGLEALRAADVVHRDLKPSNVRVQPDGQPVIIDFGLARHLTLPDLTRTEEGAAIGTPTYFAPEQFEGTKRDIDHRTDMFAVGVLMYGALTGEHPFWDGSNSIDALREAVCEGEEHLSTEGFVALPRPWQLLVARLLERRRSRRPDAATVRVLLERLKET